MYTLSRVEIKSEAKGQCPGMKNKELVLKAGSQLESRGECVMQHRFEIK